MQNYKFDTDGTYEGTTMCKKAESPLRTVLFIAGCAILGFLVPTCLVLAFTNWLDPLFY